MEMNSISITDECFSYIKDNLKEGSTILELGSGKGTVRLSKYFCCLKISILLTPFVNLRCNTITNIKCVK